MGRSVSLSVYVNGRSSSHSHHTELDRAFDYFPRSGIDRKEREKGVGEGCEIERQTDSDRASTSLCHAIVHLIDIPSVHWLSIPTLFCVQYT